MWAHLTWLSLSLLPHIYYFILLRYLEHTLPPVFPAPTLPAVNGSFPAPSAHSPNLTSPIISSYLCTALLCCVNLFNNVLGLSSSGKGSCHSYFHFVTYHAYPQNYINNKIKLKVDFLYVQLLK